MKFWWCCFSVGLMGQSLGGAIAIGGLPVLLGLPASAQLIPDSSLGAESSVVTPDVLIQGLPADLIEGGAIRGSNLFHSFEAFNVISGQAVYFANPISIENILTRVTGGNLSSIDGLLGVDGVANLFLLNPNGVIFGPNARLDISGSFLTSTGDRFTLADGSEFSAVPVTGELLSVSVPLGVQFNDPQGNITSTGILETGGDLTLIGNELYLEGQVLTGADLTLQAAETVIIRDTVTEAFVARAGDELTLQGNQGIDIWTLQHLEQTPFVSGGDLTLISDGTISGDAHFSSGGGLQFLTLAGTPGDFVSMNDPIISANGNVVFGDYTGAALKVEATGSIQGGNITITGPDTTLKLDGSGSDTDLLASSKAVILRAGVDAIASPNVPSKAGDPPTDFGTPTAPIVVDGIEQPPGSIVVGNINTFSSTKEAENGGPIILVATGDITTGGLSSFSTATRSSGGDISITALTGKVTVGGINASVAANTAQDGGDVSIQARDSIQLNGDVFTNSFAGGEPTGNGGNISLISENGSITTKTLFTYTRSQNGGRTGDGGDIVVTTGAGDIRIGNVSSTASSDFKGTPIDMGGTGDGGNVTVSTESGSITSKSVSTNSFSLSGNAGKGGAIAFAATDNITIKGDLLTASYADANGNTDAAGNVTILSTNGTISTQDILAFANAKQGNAGAGGNISIQSQDAGQDTNTATLKVNGSLDTSSLSTIGNAADGGSISLQAQSGSITIGQEVLTYSVAENTPGNGGAVSIAAPSGSILGAIDAPTTKLTTTSLTPLTTGAISQNGGDVTLSAQNEIARLDVLTQSSTGNAGKVTIQQSAVNPTELRLVNSTLTTSDQIEIPDVQRKISYSVVGGQVTIKITQTIPRDSLPSGSSGEVTIASLGDLTLDNFTILSNANGSQPAGNITVDSLGTVTLSNSQIDSDTISSGEAGSITVNAQQGVRLQAGSSISTKTSATGPAGNIEVAAPTLELFDANTQISAETRSSGNAGTITLRPYNDGSTLDIFLGDGTLITSSSLPTKAGFDGSEVTGKAGDISISAPEAITIRGEGDLKVETETAGAAGALFIEAPSITIDGVEISASTEFPENLTDDQRSTLIANRGSGAGGSIFLNTTTLSFLNGGEITAATSSTGDGGDIELSSPTGKLTIQGKGTLNVNTENIGQAGQFKIDVPTLTIDQTQLSASTTGPGAGGDVFINTAQLSFANQGEIKAATSSTGDGGNILLTSPTDELTIQGKGSISVNTENIGQAGQLEIDVATLTIDQAQLSASTTGAGAGGDVFLGADTIRFANNGAIAATTSSSGAGGNVIFSPAGDTLNIGGQGTISVETSGTGNAGTFADATNFAVGKSLVAIPNLNIDGATLSASTSGSSAGGSIAIATSRLAVTNEGNIKASTSNSGPGGSITLSTSDIDLTNGGKIEASTSGGGTGGSIIFNPAGDTLNVAGVGQISVETSGVGRAGTLRSANAAAAIAIPNLNIDGATLSASTSGPQAGGDIVVVTERISFTNNGAISASTTGPGRGGSLTVDNSGALTLRGQGRLTVGSNQTDSGQAGNLNVSAGTLRLQDGIELSANSVSRSGGGNIEVNLDGSLFMSGRSYINATSNNANAGDGGNITLNLGDGYLIGSPGQDNDIIANAVGGRGGNINVTALRILGFTEQDDSNVANLRGNRTNDISASSEFGFDGAITLNTLDLDPSQGLVELPTDLSDRANQIVASCGLGNSDDQSELVVTGRGGLPPGSGDAIDANRVNVPWVTVGDPTPLAKLTPALPSPDALVEAQALTLDGDGNAHFVAQPDTPGSTIGIASNCALPSAGN